MEITKIAMIGCGSMGGGMALLFAENGIDVSLQDPAEKAMDSVIAKAKEDGITASVTKHANYESLCKSLGEPKVFVWSLPHGTVGDKVLEQLEPYLTKGDIIIDAGNEHWRNTERRQGKCAPKGLRYVGMGVSGGYQAARRGPSMCPGGDDDTLDMVLPLLEKVAAKTPEGLRCVRKIGSGGAGHYGKMIHNGIEHGMMAALSEAVGIMTKGLDMSLDEVADVLDQWNNDHDNAGELRDTFLVRIGAEICRTVDKRTGERVLDTVEDKVVQDFTGEEGTGIWSNTEAIEHHVPAPTMATAHFLRLASGDLRQRRDTSQNFKIACSPQRLDVKDRKAFLSDLRIATYVACLASNVQGMNIILKADKAYGFHMNYVNLIHIWRAGCIIQSDIIWHLLLGWAEETAKNSTNPNYDRRIGQDFRETFASLKKVVCIANENDHIIPSLSATLEYIKYQTNTDLPTSFYEAELDYFGAHMYDRKGEDEAGLPEEGKHHYEWKPA